MRLDKRRLIPVLLIVLLALVSVIIAQKQTQRDDYVVQDFKVEDVPSDDGSGLMLSWKPLERDKRIIEYRVYRGVSPDQMFFLESIQVNPKSGVASDKMYYYDNSGSEFLDVNSPARLRREKQQPATSPLYRKIPRDIKLLAELGKSYDLLSVIEKNHLYYSSKEAYSADSADSTAYAGMKMNRQTILAFLKPGQKYYYTVLAVNERNQFQQHAQVTEGSPVPNAPDPANALYSVFLQDKNELRFEWEYPLYKDDLQQYQILMVSGVSDSTWLRVRNLPTAVENIATPITAGGVSQGYLKNYTSLPLGDMPASEIANARFSLQLVDSQGMSSYSALSSPRLVQSAMLPPKPNFKVEDKPNDKGDRLTVVWDKPIVFVTKTSSQNKENTKLKINYQLNKAETQKVKNIYFEFFKAGEDKPFDLVKEYYQDNSIMLQVPAGYDYAKGFRVKITMDTDTPKNDYVLEQDLLWDKKMMTLMPSKELYRNGYEVSTLSNVVYRRGMASDTMILVKKNTSFDNNLDVTVAYPTVLQKPVYGFSYTSGDSLISIMYNAEQPKRFARKIKAGENTGNFSLVDAGIDVTYDAKNETAIQTKLFPGPALALVKEQSTKLSAQIKELEANLATMAAMTPAPPQAAQMADQLKSLKGKLASLTSNPELQKANAIKSKNGRMRYIAGLREDYSRYQGYQVVKTDGKGMFVESDMQIDKDGKPVLTKPVSNWFDRNKFVTLFATLLFGLSVIIFVNLAKRGKDLYIRPIAGLSEIDNAIGRATEMGRPMLYCMGNGGLSDVATLASLGFLGLVANKAAEYDTKLIVPCYDYIIMPIAQEIVREAHYSVGRPDTYDKNSVFYLTNVQFAYVAGVNGIMIRERMATNFFMGFFAAEALLMTETGNAVGAVQIAGTDAITQIPFFITTCDYTLIGEELYAASAYLNREPMLLGTLKAQDYFKFVILSVVIVGAILSTFQITGLTLLLPLK